MITITNLKKQFGNFTAVDGLNFEIHKNGIFGLLGPNGAGKTTTISMICGLLKPSGGTIVFDDFDGKDPKSLIGYCPQENIFYPKLTCFEQLAFIGQIYGVTAKMIRPKALELLELLGLQDKTNERAGKLSGGMKRRLNICLALVHDPEILILDEPEAGLDPQSRILVRDFIKTFGREKTVILTTHNMDEADRLTDWVAIMDHGKLLLLDTPQNLKRTIGDGDILEIHFENENEQMVSQFAVKLASLSLKMTAGLNFLLIKHPNVVEHLPAIKMMAEESGLIISEFKLRQNTLEDVFIHMTGRTLRQ